ncbi:AraC family transcriptional regulator [Paraburkholderia unamae]|uniref:helix-turn-helix domain-containing protein n=1 Tax=Paraburkholderia unamae TaxID=219649 RepID=UPI001CB39AE7|nr:AraC family transcriptional regulator [Paraburkholderia unamae]CAG9271556.1 AraC family transcriptional regulator [Paraburkholderia unamae]
MASTDNSLVPLRCTSADRVMWITPDRVFYAGLLGAPCVRSHGAIIAYVAIDGRLRVRLNGAEWQSTEVAIIQPYVPYEIACEGRNVLNVLIEPETVDMGQLPTLLRRCGAVHAPEFASHVRNMHRRLASSGGALDLCPSDFDPTFFGEPLPSRSIDRRIAMVLESIRNNPTGTGAAADYASLVNLSFSRFLHLFKKEMGTPFRNVRTWKRARSLLHYVHTSGNLVHVALDIGYPDSTHFSHSIRHVYGLKPRDIIAGSRKLRIIAHAPAL